MMQFNVAQLLKEQVGATRDYNVSEDIGAIYGPEIRAIAPLAGVVRLVRTNRGVFMEARLETTILLSCGRCLEDYLAPVPMVIREEFLPLVDVDTGAPIPQNEEEAEFFTINENHVLDLTEVVRQYILTSLPMQQICRLDCAGLCPTCGKNLNVGPCQCEPVSVDSRMSILGELLREAQDDAQDNEQDEEDKGKE
jgi:uncharacterized protein